MKFDITDDRLPERLKKNLVYSIEKFQRTYCWEWLGYKWEGYGHIQWGDKGQQIRTHRLTYLLLVGPIPAGLVLDHLCRNRACCNPAHLEPVTKGENTRRGDTWSSGKINRAKTHCPQGHLYSKDNTIDRVRNRNGRTTVARECKTCVSNYNKSEARKAIYKRYNDKRRDALLEGQRRFREEQERKLAEKALKGKELKEIICPSNNRQP